MFAANEVWNSAILEVTGDPFDIACAKELRVFTSRRLRRSSQDIHTQADPFLFVCHGLLYLFIEVQLVGKPGHIEAYRTGDLESFEPLGTILSAPHHISYPLVFRSTKGIHMLPETGSANEVALYTFEDFPRGLIKERVLLRGNYSDSTILFRKGFWWLFTTSDEGLELFLSTDISNPFKRHPAGVISSNPLDKRCGGKLFEWNKCLYRPAQDCSEQYGGNLSIMKVDELSPTSYRETLFRKSIFDRKVPWRSAGGHHFSLEQFNGRTLIAVDGKQRDYWVNRPISLFLRRLT